MMRKQMLVLLVLALACSSQQRKAEKARDELTSWAANGAVLSQEWSRGKIMRPFAKSSVTVAIESVKRLDEALATDDEARAARQSVTQLYERLSRSIESDDHADHTSQQFGSIKEALEKQKQSQ